MPLISFNLTFSINPSMSFSSTTILPLISDGEDVSKSGIMSGNNSNVRWGKLINIISHLPKYSLLVTNSATSPAPTRRFGYIHSTSDASDGYGFLSHLVRFSNRSLMASGFKSEESKLFTITIISLSIWSLSGLVILRIIELGYDSSLSSFEIGLLGQSLLVILGVGMSWRIDSTPRGKNKVNKYVLFSRGIMAAFAIGVAVWISSLGYSLLAGLASVFPAIFLTSMVALWISQEPSVPMGAVGPMILGGASVGVYAIVAMWALPNFGILLGSIISWSLAVIFWSIPCFQFVKWRQDNSLNSI